MAKFLNELQYFRRQPHNMKVLLITNLCFAFVLPVIEIFVGAYIMRNTNNPSFVAVYQLAQYTGIVLSSLINGFLLKRINVRTLYMFGILVSGISLLVMMRSTRRRTTTVTTSTASNRSSSRYAPFSFRSLWAVSSPKPPERVSSEVRWTSTRRIR